MQGSNEGIWELPRVLSAIPGDTAVVFDLESASVRDVLDLAADLDNDVVVSSLYADALREARTYHPTIDVAYNLDVRLDQNLLPRGRLTPSTRTRTGRSRCSPTSSTAPTRPTWRSTRARSAPDVSPGGWPGRGSTG